MTRKISRRELAEILHRESPDERLLRAQRAGTLLMVGHELRTRLDELGLTQSAFARLVKVPQRTVWKWSTDRVDIPLEIEKRLAAITPAEVLEASAKDSDRRQWSLLLNRWIGKRRGAQ